MLHKRIPARLVAGPAAAMAMCLAPAAFAQPVPAHSLRDALALAYTSNPTLQAARADQRATDEGVAIARSGALPKLSATARHTEFLRRSANSFTAPSRALQSGVDLIVPVYSGGAVKNSIRAASERVAAGQASLRASESSLFSSVVASYMDVIRNEAIVGLSRNQVNVLTVNFEAASDRFEIGDLTRTDVAQSQSRLAIAQSDLRSAEANLISARETYIQLVGRAPGQLEPPPPLPGLPHTAEEAVVTALEFNPDLIASREAAEAAGYDVDVAGAGRLPTVSLFAKGSYSDFYRSLGGTAANTLSQSETTANAGVSISIPIFQGGQVAARQRQAQARSTAALERKILAERTVIAQTRAAFASWQAANAIIISSQSAVAAAELGLEGVRAENTVGNRTILDILNAEQELLSARVKLVTARRNAYVAGFSLLAAIGKAEARDLGLDLDRDGNNIRPLYDPARNYKRVRDKIWDWDRDPAPSAQATRTIDIPAQDADIESLTPVDTKASSGQ